MNGGPSTRFFNFDHMIFLPHVVNIPKFVLGAMSNFSTQFSLLFFGAID